MAHNDRAGGNAYAPHAVQPAHMPAGVVYGHIVVEGCVNAAGAKAVWHGPEAEHHKAVACGKAKEG